MDEDAAPPSTCRYATRGFVPFQSPFTARKEYVGSIFLLDWEERREKETNRLLSSGVKFENEKERVSRWSPPFPAIRRARAFERYVHTCVGVTRACMCVCIQKELLSNVRVSNVSSRANNTGRAARRKRGRYGERERETECERRNRGGGSVKGVSEGDEEGAMSGV